MDGSRTERGSVTLRLGVIGTADLRIEVADMGPGISRDLRAHLFQEFERLRAEAAAIEGAGLGLALSAGIATLMGGRLSHQDNPGGGSVFMLELPLALPDNAVDRPQALDVPERSERPIASLRVLVVDDTEMNLDIAGCFLRMAGHVVTCVNGGAKAVATAAGADFDVILMDVRMPGVDGLEATRRIRALEGPRGRTPVVAITAQAFAEQVEACRLAGMDSHLTKPFTQQALQATLAQAVSGAAARIGAAQRSPDSTPPADGGAKPEATAAARLSAAGAELRVFNPEVFEGTAGLSAEEVRSYLRTIADSAESLMLALRRDAPAPQGNLAETAHTLAGTAGMFGFDRTAAVARRFEQAAKAGAPDAQALEVLLAAVIDEALPDMRLGAAGSDSVLPAAACVSH